MVPRQLPPVLTTAAEVRAFCDELPQEGRPLVLVPTMGDLHAGHIGLVRIGREMGPTLVSIFVNPTQFAPGEDFERYPRRLSADREKLASERVAAIFAPEVGEIYPSGESTRVEVRGVTGPLCGQHRERHFLGVTTVCTKLFNICRPDVAIFGQKDAQQCLVIHRVIQDLHLGVDLVIGPTARDEDGVALSSRNRYLAEDERPAAQALSRSLDAAHEALRQGQRSTSIVEARMRECLAGFSLATDYAELRRVPDLVSREILEGRVLAAVAARVGRARLLDNRCFQLDGSSVREAPLLDRYTPDAAANRWRVGSS